MPQKLIDIHSQHQTLLLNQTNFQLEVLDAFAGSLNDFKEYRLEFGKLNKLNTVLKTLLDQEAQAKKELDYFQFLFNELEETEIKPGALKILKMKALNLKMPKQ